MWGKVVDFIKLTLNTASMKLRTAPLHSMDTSLALATVKPLTMHIILLAIINYWRVS
jgi:hypothetical protein